MLICMLTSSGANAALNKWVDADGRVHYSDTAPPVDVDAITIRKSASTESTSDQEENSGTTSEAPKSIAEREAELKKAQQEKKTAAEKASKEQAHADALKANCDAAQQNLRILKEGIRMMEIDANGERSFISDESRQAKIKQAEKDVSNYCK